MGKKRYLNKTFRKIARGEIDSEYELSEIARLIDYDFRNMRISYDTALRRIKTIMKLAQQMNVDYSIENEIIYYEKHIKELAMKRMKNKK